VTTATFPVSSLCSFYPFNLISGYFCTVDTLLKVDIYLSSDYYTDEYESGQAHAAQRRPREFDPEKALDRALQSSGAKVRGCIALRLTKAMALTGPVSMPPLRQASVVPKGRGPIRKGRGYICRPCRNPPRGPSPNACCTVRGPLDQPSQSAGCLMVQSALALEMLRIASARISPPAVLPASCDTPALQARCFRRRPCSQSDPPIWPLHRHRHSWNGGSSRQWATRAELRRVAETASAPGRDEPGLSDLCARPTPLLLGTKSRSRIKSQPISL